MRAFELAATRPWAIQEEWLSTILEIAARENTEEPEAVAARLGRRLDNTRNVRMRDGVAILPVTGPIFRRANWFQEISGATSTEILARDFNAALEDRAVQSIVLDIDSPGGEAFGIGELADMVYAARGQKPIVAYVGGLGASAAYWLASACDEIVCDHGALLGSIGVVMVSRDTRDRDAKAGIREIEFVSSQSPNKRPDPLTETGKDQIQAIVDEMAAVFIGAVARNRDITAKKVVEDFGRGGVLVGAAAVKAGMADRVGSLEATIQDLSTWDARRPANRSTASHGAASSARSGAHQGGVTMSTETQESMGLLAAMKAVAGLSPTERAQLFAIAGGNAPTADANAGARTPAPEKTARERELEANLESERKRRVDLEAKSREERAAAFASGLLKANRILPVQADLLKPLHARLAAIDAEATDAAAPKLTAGLEAIFADAPAHVLTTELLAPEGAQVLEPVAAKPEAAKKAEEDAKAWIAETNPSPAPGRKEAK